MPDWTVHLKNPILSSAPSCRFYQQKCAKVFWYGMFDEPSRPGYQLGAFGQQTYANLATLLTGCQVLGKDQRTRLT